MRATEFLDEGIIDKLKGAAKRRLTKQPAAANVTSSPASPVSADYDYQTPAYKRKQDMLAKQAAAAAAPPPAPLPKMKPSKRNRNTAIGSKSRGRSPEYKAAQAQIQSQNPAPAKPAAQTATPGVDQNMLAKAVIGSVKQITDPNILNGIKAFINTKT